MTKQVRTSRARRMYARLPTTRRGRLAFIAAGSVIVSLKLILGLGALAVIVHLFAR